jgi:hypothetical protein
MGDLSVVAESAVRTIGQALRGVRTERAQAELPALTHQYKSTWRRAYMAPDELDPYLAAWASSEDVANELAQLWWLYVEAACEGFIVLIE